MRNELDTIVAERGAATTVAKIHGLDAASGRPLVVLPGERRAVKADALWSREPVDWKACRGLRALVLVPEGGDPVVLGLLDPPPASLPRAKKVVVLEGEEEVILRCGKAEIALSADGRISILGGHIVSRSTGVHRIKGASVEIN
jgi:hypothetical protein